MKNAEYSIYNERLKALLVYQRREWVDSLPLTANTSLRKRNTIIDGSAVWQTKKKECKSRK